MIDLRELNKGKREFDDDNNDDGEYGLCRPPPRFAARGLQCKTLPFSFGGLVEVVVVCSCDWALVFFLDFPYAGAGARSGLPRHPKKCPTAVSGRWGEWVPSAPSFLPPAMQQHHTYIVRRQAKGPRGSQT